VDFHRISIKFERLVLEQLFASGRNAGLKERFTRKMAGIRDFSGMRETSGRPEKHIGGDAFAPYPLFTMARIDRPFGRWKRVFNVAGDLRAPRLILSLNAGCEGRIQRKAARESGR
jgi:hypothetical protein